MRYSSSYDLQGNTEALVRPGGRGNQLLLIF